ncbi:MAG: hypothetical protein WKG07_03055 [Hymenobacter sp.]
MNMLPEIQRINGIGRASILGSRQYAMRIWLKLRPDAGLQHLGRRHHESPGRAERYRLAGPHRAGRRRARRKRWNTC